MTIQDYGSATDLLSNPSNVSWAAAVASEVAKLLSGITPTGTLAQFTGASSPTGWLLCQGQSVDTTQYAALFAVIGYTYGGSGASFLLPDCRGRIPVGLDTAQSEFAALATNGGTKTEVLSIAALPSHTHGQNAHNHVVNAHTHGYKGGTSNGDSWGFPGSSSGGWAVAEGSVNNNIYREYLDNTTAPIDAATATNQNTGGSTAHNNLQPYIALNYIIKV